MEAQIWSKLGWMAIFNLIVIFPKTSTYSEKMERFLISGEQIHPLLIEV